MSYKLKIPRRMNFFWAGRMSWIRWLTIHTFVELNPDWEVILHYVNSDQILRKSWKTDTDDDNRYKGEDYREKIPMSVRVIPVALKQKMSAAQACDTFQWNLLATDGGFFSDMDILWINPIGHALREVSRCDAIFCLEKGMMAIGLVGSCPDNTLFKELISSENTTPNCDYQYYGTNLIYRFLNLSNINVRSRPGDIALRTFRRIYPKLDIGQLSDNTVYPFDWRQIPDIFEKECHIPKETVGIHWFGGDPIADKWNRELTPNNWVIYHNTFTKAIRCLTSRQVSVSPPIISRNILRECLTV